MLNAKLKNLLRAYKATKDNTNRTGASASSAPYQDIMEEIFGTRPEIANSHTLSLMDPTPSVGLDISASASCNSFSVSSHIFYQQILVLDESSSLLQEELCASQDFSGKHFSFFRKYIITNKYIIFYFR